MFYNKRKIGNMYILLKTIDLFNLKSFIKKTFKTSTIQVRFFNLVFKVKIEFFKIKKLT